MQDLSLGETWAAAAVILGFQLVNFAWRLSRELELMKTHSHNPNWFPPADHLNVLSMLVLVLTVFAAFTSKENAALGLRTSLILLAGYPLAMLGHYRLFKPGKPKPRPYCTLFEAVVVIGTIVLATWFMISHHLYDYGQLNRWIPGILIVGVIFAAFMGWWSERKKKKAQIPHKNYIDPKGYWGDPEGNIRRMSDEGGEQEVIATITRVCSEAEWKTLCRAIDDATRPRQSSR
jgi:amino acid transporter